LRVGFAKVVAFEFSGLVDLASQKATAKRPIRQCGDNVFAAPGDDVLQGFALEEVERWLSRGERRYTAKALHCVDGVVRDADRPNLSIFLEVEQRLSGFFVLCREVRPMDLVEIDVVRPQPFQRHTDLVEDLYLARVTDDPVSLPLETNFGCDDDLVAAATL